MPRGRPREFDADRALDAALLLFWRHGYEGTSLAMLVKAMKINMPSLYAAFGNKEELFHKALERYLQKPASYLMNALSETKVDKAVNKLFRGAIDMVMHPRHPDGCLLVHGALASGPEAAEIRRELNARRAKAQALIRKRFELAAASGDLPRDADPALLARYITTVLWGLSVQAAGGASRKHLQETADFALRAWRRSRSKP